jgi:nitrile hydratase accessory protein
LSAPDAEALPGLPRDAGGPVFAEPWQAQAFALAVRLSAEGAFSWAEWAEALSRRLAADPADDGSRYYEHWVAALETLLAGRGLTGAAELAARKQAWAQAYRHTPHGKPVELGAGASAATPERGWGGEG